MKIKYLITILLVSLILTGCGQKVSDTEEVDKQNEVTGDPSSAEADPSNAEAGWQVYEEKELGVRLKYPADWVYQKDEQAEQELDRILYVGFAPNQSELSKGIPYPIEFIIAKKNVEMTFEEEVNLLGEDEDKRYVLAGYNKYKKAIDVMAESFEPIEQ